MYSGNIGCVAKKYFVVKLRHLLKREIAEIFKVDKHYLSLGTKRHPSNVVELIC